MAASFGAKNMSNRPIEFRGMNISGQWHYGLLCHVANEWFISNEAGQPRAYQIRPETIGQFTGLLDRDGKKIFEGDILATENSNPNFDIWDKEYWGYTNVIWDDYDLMWRGSNWTWSHSKDGSVYSLEFIKIIGNVYEHPQLLENLQ